MISIPSIVAAPSGAAMAVSPALARAGSASAATGGGMPTPLMPVNSVLPAITGTVQEGQILSVSNGTWTNAPSAYSYQWRRAGVAITGSINATRTLASGDVGALMTCTVTATNAAGSSSATSVSTVAVIAASVPVPVNTVAPAVTGTGTVGQVLTADNGTWSNAPTSYAYAWRRDGVDILGATIQTYLLVDADAGKTITCRVFATNGGGTSGSTSNSLGIALPNLTTIGGVAIGTVGTQSHNTGYTLRSGDDYTDTLSIIGPSTPRARYSTTKGGYAIAGASARSSPGLAMYDADPLHTGYLDSNRGVPVPGWANSIVQSGGVLTCNVRNVVSADLPHMIDTSKPAIGSMMHTGGYLLANAPCVIEARVKWTAQLRTHLTWWFMQLTTSNGYRTWDDIELDFEAGASDGRNLDFNGGNWVGGNVTFSAIPGPIVPNNAYRTIAMRADENGNVDWFMDDDGAGTNMVTRRATYSAQQAKVLAGAFYLLMTGHAYQAAWIPGDPDASISMDWIRFWTKGGGHYVPQVAGQTYRVDFGAAAAFTLPDTATVWGGAVTEVVCGMAQEDNEPGGDAFGGYALFPAGISFNPATYALSVASTVTKPGRHIINRVVRQTAASCEAQRVLLEVGPVINANTLNVTNGAAFSFDLYAACDVGQILPKTIAVAGLPTGLAFSASTGLITGTATTNGTYNITVTATNASGQAAIKVLALTVASATGYAYEGWNGPGWFDASDGATVVATGVNVTSLANKRSGGGNLTAGGSPASNLTTVAAAQNGKSVIRCLRNVTSASAVTRLSASSAVQVSQAFQGSDKPYTVICVYRPTDSNTGYIWAASSSTDGTDAETIALVRRNASACSIRRGNTTATTNDVNFGTGQVSGGYRIVAVQHTGTTVSVWDTSLTKAVDAVLQDANAFSSTLAFRLFAAAGPGTPTSPILTTTQCNEDFAECLVESSARTEMEIRQAITDLASKWGIALT